jgi:competence protein ComFC
MLTSLFKFLLPKKCSICSEHIDESSDFCPSCFASLSFANEPWCNICGSRFEYAVDGKMTCGLCMQEKPSYDIARHLLIFNDNSKKSIHSLKFCDKTIFAEIYAKLLFNKFRNEIENYDLIVPVPMYFLKRWFRMYNQAQLISLYLSKVSGKKMRYVLQKTKWTKAQSSLKASDRVQNLRSTIIVSDKTAVRDKSVILVDDVYTTGSTVKLCARKLKEAGAKKIMVLTIAKTYRS